VDTTSLILLLAVLWLASALLVTALVAKADFIEPANVVTYTVFGPLSFLIIAYYFAEERVPSLWRHLKRRAAR
jgi:hypothetical protein